MISIHFGFHYFGFQVFNLSSFSSTSNHNQVTQNNLIATRRPSPRLEGGGGEHSDYHFSKHTLKRLVNL